MSLISLIYLSFATQTWSDTDLKMLLQSCRTNNTAKKITGMLLYRDKFFMQVLEGDAADVEPLFEQIKRDQRHMGVLVVHKKAISARSFVDWSMGFNKIGDAAAAQLPGFTDFLAQPNDGAYFAQKPDLAHKLLLSFKAKDGFYELV
ncbi:MAG: BLUF domain-containing protein [Chloroflexota bacterium]|nr:BLUF domain-containing protein [Chloroflexota bacterium]